MSVTDNASRFTRRRLAWAAPAVGLAVVAAAVAIPMVASASPSLPHKSAAQLLVDVSKSSGDTAVRHGRRDRPAGSAGAARHRWHRHLADGSVGRLAHGARVVRRRPTRRGSPSSATSPRPISCATVATCGSGPAARTPRSTCGCPPPRRTRTGRRPVPARPSRSPRSRPRSRRSPRSTRPRR